MFTVNFLKDWLISRVNNFFNPYKFIKKWDIWWSVIFNVQSQFNSIFLIHLAKSFFGWTCCLSCYQLIESLWYTKNYFDVTNIDKDNFKYFCQDIDIYIYIYIHIHIYIYIINIYLVSVSLLFISQNMLKRLNISWTCAIFYIVWLLGL